MGIVMRRLHWALVYMYVYVRGTVQSATRNRVRVWVDVGERARMKFYNIRENLVAHVSLC